MNNEKRHFGKSVLSMTVLLLLITTISPVSSGEHEEGSHNDWDYWYEITEDDGLCLSFVRFRTYNVMDDLCVPFFYIDLNQNYLFSSNERFEFLDDYYDENTLDDTDGVITADYTVPFSDGSNQYNMYATFRFEFWNTVNTHGEFKFSVHISDSSADFRYKIFWIMDTDVLGSGNDRYYYNEGNTKASDEDDAYEVNDDKVQIKDGVDGYRVEFNQYYSSITPRKYCLLYDASEHEEDPNPNMNEEDIDGANIIPWFEAENNKNSYTGLLDGDYYCPSEA